MKNFYEVGKVYVWMHVSSDLTHLIGTEVTVVGLIEEFEAANGTRQMGQLTDVHDDHYHVMALPGDLRPKNPPSGEQSIADMFNQTYCVPA
jgi:hypothetical protein